MMLPVNERKRGLSEGSEAGPSGYTTPAQQSSPSLGTMTRQLFAARQVNPPGSLSIGQSPSVLFPGVVARNTGSRAEQQAAEAEPEVVIAVEAPNLLSK